jgi:hypothetical protein
MDSIGMGYLRSADQARDVKVTQGNLWRADADRFVGVANMERFRIGGRIHRYRADLQFLAGANNAEGDFPPISHQNLGNIGIGGRFSPGVETSRGIRPRPKRLIRKRGWPYSTGWAFSTKMDSILPAISASISFINFMASMMPQNLALLDDISFLNEGFRPRERGPIKSTTMGDWTVTSSGGAAFSSGGARAGEVEAAWGVKKEPAAGGGRPVPTRMR